MRQVLRVVGIRPVGRAAVDETREPNGLLICQEDQMAKAGILSITQPVTVKRFAPLTLDGRQDRHVRVLCIAHGDPGVRSETMFPPPHPTMWVYDKTRRGHPR